VNHHFVAKKECPYLLASRYPFGLILKRRKQSRSVKWKDWTNILKGCCVLWPSVLQFQEF